MADLIDRQKAIRNICNEDCHQPIPCKWKCIAIEELEGLPSVQPERLTDDDFETIRIHLNAFKENLCNQRRWKEAEEYQRIIDRFMAFTSTQPRKGEWIDYSDEGFVECPFCHSATNCDGNKDELHYCFSCGAELRGDNDVPESIT